MKIYYSLKALETVLRARKPDKVVLVTSAFLRRKLGWAVKEVRRLTSLKIEIVEIPDGEEAKNWDNLGKLLVKFVIIGLTKRSLVIAFGGGSVSDLAGLACSIYKRGAVSHINVPTTLLAQVDASIGGKTAIDFEGHKNLVGTFRNPSAIFLSVGFLESLSEEQFFDGLAEIIKAGLINDPEILDILDSCDLLALRKNSRLLVKLVVKAVAVKQYFVGKDLEDNGVRQALNVGHTIGHALELRYKLSHGRAVLLGMVKELMVAKLLGIETLVVRKRLGEVLSHFGIVFDHRQFIVDQESIFHDKKVGGEKIVLPVVVKVGKVKLLTVRLDELMVAIKNCN